MRKVLKKLSLRGRSPLTIIEFILGVFTIVGGLYLASPLLVVSVAVAGPTPLVAALASPIITIIFGSLYAITGFATIYGIYKYNYFIRAQALFFNMGIRTFTILTTFLVQGIFPLSWLASLAVITIAMVLYLHNRRFSRLIRKGKL